MRLHILKKFIVFLLPIILLVSFFGCKKDIKEPGLSSEISTAFYNIITTVTVRSEDVTIFVPKLNSIKLEQTYSDHPYRLTYYDSGHFEDLAPDPHECAEWIYWYDEVVDVEEMFLVVFVKRYDIKREDFEKVVKRDIEFYLELGWDLTNELAEPPNADIVYTFDNEIINAYYRRENPVEPDWSKIKTYDSYSAYLEAQR